MGHPIGLYASETIPDRDHFPSGGTRPWFRLTRVAKGPVHPARILHPRPSFQRRDHLNQMDFNGFPLIGEVVVSRWQRPDTVQMVEQHHPGIQVKRT